MVSRDSPDLSSIVDKNYIIKEMIISIDYEKKLESKRRNRLKKETPNILQRKLEQRVGFMEEIFNRVEQNIN